MSFKEIRKALRVSKHTKRPRVWGEYFYSIFSPITVSLDTHDYWGLLFIGCISLFQPKLFFLAIIYMALKTNRRVAERELKEQPSEVEQLILFIHMNHLQSLTEAIESNPQLLYCDYKKKSLLHWCKHYNNTKALMVITQMTQKYPKEQLLAA